MVGTHIVQLARVSDSTRVPLANDGKVKPGEPVYYQASGLRRGEAGVEFRVIYAETGETWAAWTAPTASLSGNTSVYASAPDVEGPYRLVVRSQSYVFLPQTHLAETAFIVSKDAPKPIPPEPERPSMFEDIKTLGFIALGIMGLVVVGQVVGRVKRNPVRRKRWH